METKYTVKKTEYAGGMSEVSVKRHANADDVGRSIGIGLGLLIAGNRAIDAKIMERNAQTAQKHLDNGEYEQAITVGDRLVQMSDKAAKLGGHMVKARA